METNSYIDERDRHTRIFYVAEWHYTQKLYEKGDVEVVCVYFPHPDPRDYSRNKYCITTPWGTFYSRKFYYKYFVSAEVYRSDFDYIAEIEKMLFEMIHAPYPDRPGLATLEECEKQVLWKECPHNIVVLE